MNENPQSKINNQKSSIPRSYVDDAVDDLYGLWKQLGAVIFLMGGSHTNMGSARDDLRAYLSNISDQVLKVTMFLSDCRRQGLKI